MSSSSRIPEAEADVLSALFDPDQATARDVREVLALKRPMAHGTVVTLLRRLEARGLVRRRKADTGKAFVYSPPQGHALTFGPAVTSLMQRAFGGKPAATGLWTPLIVLPQSSVDRLDPAAMDAVLAHEVAHHARRDWAVDHIETTIASESSSNT